MKETYSLPPGKELGALTSLSEGMCKLLDKCDLVSPDSSFILYSIGNFYSYGVTSINPYFNHGTSSTFTLDALLNMYADISSKQNKEIKREELRDIVDENFLRRDLLSYYLLNEALNKDNFLFTEQTCREISSVCSRFIKKIRAMSNPKKIMRYFKKDAYIGFPSEDGRTIRCLNEECAYDMAEILKESKNRIRKIKKDILSIVYKKNKILPSTRRFNLREGGSDDDIIDTVLDNGNRVGIISCDYKDFKVKIPKIIWQREMGKLKIPEVFLLEPRKGLTLYSLLRYSSDGLPPVYLQRA